ncbi:MAG TPA: MoxR family ATPase [Actinomycetes bacterium]|nr:MoxR family ATPase [Actinomycetes bacterium]
MTTMPTLTTRETATLAGQVLDEIETVVVGRRRALELVLLGVLGRGHVLLEDVPGLGKTMMARSFSEALGLTFHRVQFTPDLLPADLTGVSVFDPATNGFLFRPGPVFTQLLLADEINRTPPKTQAALLEAMAEEQVSSDGETRPLPQPFVVLATDNPIEYEGTYSLPEAQLDRFLLRVSLGYLGLDDEQELLRRRLDNGWTPPPLSPVVDAATLLAMRDSLETVQVEAPILRYVVELVDATRNHPQVTLGASPRGGLALVALARGQAVLDRRDYVTPEDVKAVAVPALAHRLSLRPELWVRRVTGGDVVSEILATVPTPR